MSSIIQVLICVAICAILGYADYMYLSKQELLSAKKCIICVTVMQLFIAALMLYKYCSKEYADILLIVRHMLILECTSIVTITDYRKQIIPNKIMLIALYARGIMLIPEFIILREEIITVLIRNAAACIIPIILMILGLCFMKNSIGMGDVKLLFIIALFTDFAFLFNTLFYALIAALIVSIVLLLTKKIKANESIAFAPFLLIGVYLSIILGVA